MFMAYEKSFTLEIVLITWRVSIKWKMIPFKIFVIVITFLLICSFLTTVFFLTLRRKWFQSYLFFGVPTPDMLSNAMENIENITRNHWHLDRRCSAKKGVLRNFPKFKNPVTLLKKSLWHRLFPVNFEEFLRTPFYRRYPGDCFCKLRHFWFEFC